MVHTIRYYGSESTNLRIYIYVLTIDEMNSKSRVQRES